MAAAGNNVMIHTLRVTWGMLTPPQRRQALLLAAMMLLGALLDVMALAALIPVMMSALDNNMIHSNVWLNRLYDYGGFESNRSFMIFLVLSLLGIFTAKTLYAILLTWKQASFSYNVSTVLSRRQFRMAYAQGFSYFKETHSSEIINDTLNIPAFFTTGVLLPLTMFITEILVFTMIVVGIAVNDILLFTSLVLVLLPTVGLTYYFTRNRIQQMGDARNIFYVSAHSRLNQAVLGFVDVVLARKQGYFLNAYSQEQRKLNQVQIWLHFYQNLPYQVLQFTAVLGIVLIFLYSYLKPGAEAEVLKFVSIFAAAAFRVIPSVNRLMAALISVKSNQLSVEKLADSLQYEQDTSGKPLPPLAFNQQIELRGIRFAWADAAQPTLQDVSLTVQKGETIGIIGESGSGKTTLMNLLLRFVEETEGGVYVDGVQVDAENRDAWRRLTAYVQQGVFLMDGSIRENIAFGFEPEEVDEAKLWRVLEQASLAKLVRSLPNGLDTRVGEMGGRLSGGQRQRIGIARALYRDSEVLVLDEATSALDSETEREITESITALSGTRKTIFVIAHRITTLRSCDRIIEFRDGRIHRIADYATVVREKLGE